MGESMAPNFKIHVVQHVLRGSLYDIQQEGHSSRVCAKTRQNKGSHSVLKALFPHSRMITKHVNTFTMSPRLHKQQSRTK